MHSIIMDTARYKGFTQSALAEEIGVDAGYLSKALSGEVGLKLDIIDKIFALAGVRIITEQEHEETEAALRFFARRLL